MRGWGFIWLAVDGVLGGGGLVLRRSRGAWQRTEEVYWVVNRKGCR